jgi:hypothetical protein
MLFRFKCDVLNYTEINVLKANVIFTRDINSIYFYYYSCIIN